MNGSILIAATVLAAAIYLPPRSEPQQGPAEVEQKAQAETHAHLQQPASTQNKECPAAHTAPANNQPPHWYGSPEWVLVVVGIVTAGVIWFQSWATLRAARATERMVEPTGKSAEAALLNAKAAINAERAWVLVTMDRKATDYYALVVTNHGRTPAEILGIQRVENFPEKTDDLPDMPNYGLPTEFLQRRILVPNEVWIYETTSLGQVVPAEMLPDISKSKRRYYQYGVVRYRDVLSGTEHETRFSFMFSPTLQNWIVNGPTREYTKYT